jgi:TadE-like protein
MLFLQKLAPRLQKDKCGIAAVEFAMVLPPFVLMLMGGMDIGHSIYTNSLMQGAVQKAGRDSALEGGTASAQQVSIDNQIKEQIKSINQNADVTLSRRYYKTFSQASAALEEVYTDTNANHICDAGEPYQDRNRNGVWDSDGADSGQGGAKDVVVYTTRIRYPRLFPMFNFVGLSQNIDYTATTVLANQPYGEQSATGTPVARNCPV